MSPVNAPIICRACGDSFTARFRKGRTRPEVCPACAREWLGQKQRGIAPVHALAGKQRKALERARLLLQAAFGAITDRDVAVFERGRKFGYLSGYNAAYRKPIERTS